MRRSLRWRARADVQHANEKLKDAQSSLRHAEEGRERAEAVLVAANTRPTRALLPGLLGNTAPRREKDERWQEAKTRLQRSATNGAAVRFAPTSRQAPSP